MSKRSDDPLIAELFDPVIPPAVDADVQYLLGYLNCELVSQLQLESFNSLYICSSTTLRPEEVGKNFAIVPSCDVFFCYNLVSGDSMSLPKLFEPYKSRIQMVPVIPTKFLFI